MEMLTDAVMCLVGFLKLPWHLNPFKSDYFSLVLPADNIGHTPPIILGYSYIFRPINEGLEPASQVWKGVETGLKKLHIHFFELHVRYF